MSSDTSQYAQIDIEEVFDAHLDESSEEPPMTEWSSLVFKLPEENRKRLLFQQGLYRPGNGEICTKYIAQSDSDVFRHVYYNYPPVTDPGIEDALLQPEHKIIYAADGQELYLALCKEMNLCPVRKFYRSLVEPVIDLRYYCVDPNGVFAMAKALQANRIVKVLNLTDNFLNDDACYHLSEMLSLNSSLEELNLAGCRIGPHGAQRLFAGLPANRALKVLDLSRNHLGDTGAQHFAKAILANIDVREINLAGNAIGGYGALAIAEALETYNRLTHINLSKNNLYNPPSGIINLLYGLSENQFLQDLNLSWNSLSGSKISAAIRSVFKCTLLSNLDISNNKFCLGDIPYLMGFMVKPKKMISYNLSYNPLTPDDALLVITKLKNPAVKLKNLIMDNVFVDGKFLTRLEQMKQIKSKKDVVVTYGGVITKVTSVSKDPRELLLNRMEFLAKKSKKNPVDIALVSLKLLRDKNELMQAKTFISVLQATGAPWDDDLLNEIVNVFAGPKTKKLKTVDVRLLVDFIRRKWPDRKLHQTPPPEPEPEMEPEPEVALKKGKGKSKRSMGMGKSSVVISKNEENQAGSWLEEKSNGNNKGKKIRDRRVTIV